MKTHRPRTKGLRVLSMSALALVLGHASVHLDLNGFGLQVTQAYADSVSSCFVANTRVRMADGSLRAIETIKVGDRVLGRDGRVNAVVAVERVPLGVRKLFAFNGGRPFVTQEHPFMTRHGWHSIEPASTRKENPQLRVAPLREGDQLLVWSARTAATPIIRGNLALAAAAEVALEAIALTRIEAFAAPPDTTLYNLLLDGDHVYFADDFLVHDKGGDGRGRGRGEAPGRGRGQDAEVAHGLEIGHGQRRGERSRSAPSSSAALASGTRNTTSAQVASEVAAAGAALSAGEEAAAIAGNWGRSVRQ